VPLVIGGLGEMYNNYKDERDLRQLQIILSKKETFNELQKQNLIYDSKKDFFINSLKREVSELIERKRS
jgi:hypothetical protein